MVQQHRAVSQTGTHRIQERKHRLPQAAEDSTGATVTPEPADSSCGGLGTRFTSSEKETGNCHEGDDSRTHEHSDDIFWRLEGKLEEGAFERLKDG